ncbi:MULTISPECIES: acyl carrier protein [Streptomyces]|jgi:acyl carrier protein|uniref:Acyl carrier protein n=1 Tax=Streptomyces lavendulocolor TaxID=67316 RepID=A0ABV2W066_9ACTN|nr:hypothetical protein A4V12_12820 [Streptomyces noursei]
MTQQQNAGFDASYYQEKISEIVTEELELEPGELTVSGDFIEDYDGDSLALITVVSRIEKELGVALPKEGLEELKTLGHLLDAVYAKLTEALQYA